jgi:hypothetical protein
VNEKIKKKQKNARRMQLNELRIKLMDTCRRRFKDKKPKSILARLHFLLANNVNMEFPSKTCFFVISATGCIFFLQLRFMNLNW